MTACGVRKETVQMGGDILYYFIKIIYVTYYYLLKILSTKKKKIIYIVPYNNIMWLINIIMYSSSCRYVVGIIDIDSGKKRVLTVYIW